MVRIGPMASPKFPLESTRTDGRIGRCRPRPDVVRQPGAAQGRPRVGTCEARPIASPCRPGAPAYSGLVAGKARPAVQARRHRRIGLGTAFQVPWPCSTGAESMAPRQLEPLTGRRPLRKASRTQMPLRHAGTFLCDLGLLGDGQATADRARTPLIVRESEPVAVDRDEVLLIEEWRVGPTEPRLRRARSPTTPRLSIRLTGKLRSISQPDPTNGSDFASSAAANALLLQ